LNIILIGFKNSGKTTLGKKLASYLKWPFFDTDQMLLAKYKKSSISELYTDLGEAKFREEEQKILEAMNCTQTVIALGGGSLHEGTKETICRLGLIVYLKLPKSEVLQRKPWPSFIKTEQEAEALFEKRAALFEKVAFWDIFNLDLLFLDECNEDILLKTQTQSMLKLRD
jgi:shikimate kinase